MNKDKLIRDTARYTGVRIEVVDLILNSAIDIIKHHVEHGERVTIANFLTLFLLHRKSYYANDVTRERRMKVPEHKMPKAKISYKWRRKVYEETKKE